MVKGWGQSNRWEADAVVNQTSFIHSTNTLWTLTKGPALDRCCGYILVGEEHKYKHIRKCGILTRTTELQHGLMRDTWMQLISLAPVSLLASAAGTAKPRNYISQNSLQLGLRDKLVALNPYDCWNREKKSRSEAGPSFHCFRLFFIGIQGAFLQPAALR